MWALKSGRPRLKSQFHRENHHWLCRVDAVFKEVNGSTWHEAGTCSVLVSTSMGVSEWALSVNVKKGRIL